MPAFFAPLLHNFLNSGKTTSYVSGSHSGRVGKFGTPAQVASSVISGRLNSGYNTIRDLIDRNSGSSFSPVGASAAYYDSVGDSSAKTFDYINADLARQYGMSPETAYQEALSNTSYQRSVKDMQAAGLNPAALFGAGRVYYNE